MVPFGANEEEIKNMPDPNYLQWAMEAGNLTVNCFLKLAQFFDGLIVETQGKMPSFVKCRRDVHGIQSALPFRNYRSIVLDYTFFC